MTRTLIALSAVLSICVAGGQTLGDDSPGMASDPGSGTEPASFSNVPGLVSVVQLNEGQVASLRRLNYEFEDELFPLLQQLREKEWELQRLSRSKDVDETMVDMVIQSIEALYEQVRSVGVRHREQARAMLSSHQLGALGKLETALELSDAARESCMRQSDHDARGLRVHSGTRVVVRGSAWARVVQPWLWRVPSERRIWGLPRRDPERHVYSSRQELTAATRTWTVGQGLRGARVTTGHVSVDGPSPGDQPSGTGAMSLGREMSAGRHARHARSVGSGRPAETRPQAVDPAEDMTSGRWSRVLSAPTGPLHALQRAPHEGTLPCPANSGDDPIRHPRIRP